MKQVGAAAAVTNSYRLVLPIDWSMAICLLKPFPFLEPVNSNSPRRFLFYVNYTLALFFLIVSWLFPIRVLLYFLTSSTLFAATQTGQGVVSNVYFGNIFLYQVLGVAARTCMFVHFFHSGRRIDRTLNALRREIGPTCEENSKRCARRVAYLVSFFAWTYVLSILTTMTVIYVTRFQSYRFMFYPLSVYSDVLDRSEVARWLAISYQILSHLSSDSASAMTNAFIFYYNVLLAYCFRSLKTELKRRINSHHGDETEEEEALRHVPVDVEHYRLRHLRLGAIVRAWDANIRPVVSATLGSAFLCCITYMYLVLYGQSGESFYTFVYSSMLFIAATLVIVNLTSASYLNCSAHSIANAVLLLRQVDTNKCEKCQLSPDQQLATAVQVNLFINQVSSEPIGITMLGLTHIHRSNVVSVSFYNIISKFSAFYIFH